MRIAVFANRFPALSETFVLDHVVALLQRGHEVEIFAWPGRADATAHPEVVEHRLLERTRCRPPAPRGRARRAASALALVARHGWRRPAITRESLAAAREGARPLELLRGSVPHLGRWDFDLVHCHYAANGELAVRLRRAGLQAKIVTTLHGHDTRRLERDPLAFPALRKEGDHFVAVSGYNARVLAAAGIEAERIDEIPLGVDVGALPFRWEDGPPKREPLRILTVARLVREKGIEHAIAALGELRERRPDLEFLYQIVGSGPLERELRHRVTDAGLSDRVLFLGALDRIGVRQELARTDLFLLPSVVEAAPVALLEAQAAGIPCLCTDVGSVRDLVLDGYTGRVVGPRSAPRLADGLADLIERRDDWPAMGRRAREHVAAHYDAAALHDRLEAIYARLVNATSPR